MFHYGESLEGQSYIRAMPLKSVGVMLASLHCMRLDEYQSGEGEYLPPILTTLSYHRHLTDKENRDRGRGSCSSLEHFNVK